MSNCFLASAQSKHRVKNLSLYNLMAAKMIGELETAYAFLRIIHCLNGIEYKKKKFEEENLNLAMVAEVLNELRLNEI